jgi:carbon-monoxide dehydrogenase medium subunit
MTPVQELVDLPAPIGPCAANVADVEVRSQGTLGGNLCAGQAREAPRGDLQAALIAVGATVRSAGRGGEKTEAVEEFLSGREGRLVLDVSYDEPAAGAFAALDRTHTHDYTALAVAAARSADGGMRLAASGVAGPAARLSAAEAKADDPEAAGAAALTDVTFADDALASAWYREKTLPVLVRRALSQLQEAR